MAEMSQSQAVVRSFDLTMWILVRLAPVPVRFLVSNVRSIFCCVVATRNASTTARRHSKNQTIRSCQGSSYAKASDSVSARVQ
jgi:hypothetical protein